MRAARVGPLCAALAFACFPASASAAPTPIRLDVSAGPGCPSLDEIVADVRREAPNLALSDVAPRHFKVTFAPEADGQWRGELVVESAETAVGSREVREASCPEAARVIAFAIVLAYDPTILVPPPPPPLPPPPPIPSPPLAGRPGPSAPRRSLVWSLRADGFVASDMSPNPTAGAAMVLGLDLSRAWLAPSFRLGAEYGASASTTVDAAVVRLSLASGSLEGCLTPWADRTKTVALHTCVRVDAGAYLATASNIPNGREVTHPWLSVGPLLAADLRVAGPVFVELAGDVFLPLVDTQVMLVPQIHVYDVSPAGIRGRVGLGVTFR
jgi:hypothetical protein